MHVTVPRASHRPACPASESQWPARAQSVGRRLCRRLIWNPVHLVQGSTRRYVLVRASTYLTRYMAVRETSKWYIPVRTDIEISYGSIYWYVLVCTALYLHSTKWYKVVQDGTRWYKVVQTMVCGGTWRYKAYENRLTGTGWYVLACTDPYDSIWVRCPAAGFAAAILPGR